MLAVFVVLARPEMAGFASLESVAFASPELAVCVMLDSETKKGMQIHIPYLSTAVTSLIACISYETY